MSDMIDEIAVEELIADTGKPPEPGHDAWFRQKVKKTLQDAKAGRLTYRTLDEVAADYGFDAS